MGKIDGSRVAELWKKGQDDIGRLLVNYAVNTAFVYGDQWIKPKHEGSRELVQVPRDPDRVRVTVNRIGPSLRAIQAKLGKRPLVWEVPAPGGDDASAGKARRAEAIVQSTAEVQDWEQIRAEANWMTLLGGTAVLSSDWDPAAGTYLREDDQGRTVGTGEPVVRVSSIAEVAFEPGCRNGRFGRYWIRAQALPPDEAQDTYRLEKKPPADSAGLIGQYGISDITRSGARIGPGLTMVYHYYRRPSRKDPEGEMAVVIGGETVESGPWPFPYKDRLNVVVQRETIVARHWAGDTVVTSAVPIQTAYNQAWSSLIEHTKLAGFATGWVPSGTVEMVDDLVDIPGSWYQYMPGPDGGPPQYLSPPQLPQWVIDQPAMLRREIDDILGVQEITRGGAPSNVESGLGLSILAEQADTPITQLAVESARAWSDLASDVLELLKAKATETRTAEVWIPGRAVEGVKWKGKDLEGVTRARVPYDAVLPKSRAAQQALAMELWEKGIVQDPEKIAEIGDLPDKESFVNALNADVSKAARENYDLAVGGEAYFREFDDHPQHIRVHNEFRKSRQYQALPDNLKKAFDDHVLEHENAGRDEQVEVAAEEMMSPLGEAPALADEADLVGALLGAEAPPGDTTMPGLGEAGELSAEGLP